MRAYLRRGGPALAGLLLALALALGSATGAGEQLRRAATMSGGGAIGAGALRLRSSVGQPAIGAVSNQIVLCGGLQCGAGAPAVAPVPDERLYLPVVAR
ncbi:MAG TPA: hypothetical protein PKD53_18105 [Chloroflexaceae bacterium]|nr:hypothetical protein [Chloroflexaceae bacterium]